MIPGFEVQKSREGVVEVFLNGVWGVVCYKGIGQFEVDALGPTLGFRCVKCLILQCEQICLIRFQMI